MLGGRLCLAVTLASALFLYGVAVRSYWALALPVGAALLFVLGLVFWIGWTIATVRIEAEGQPLGTAVGGPGAATVPDAGPQAPGSPPSSPSS